MTLTELLLSTFAGVTSGIVGVAVYVYLEKRRERKAQEQREMEQAVRMFEQRIALKPRHMGARHASGAAPVVFGEVDSETKD